MPLAATVDNFANLTDNPWAIDGISVASNAVSATVAGTFGDIKLTHGPTSTNGDEARIAFDIIPDKTDTVGRFVFVGSTRNHTSDQGMGAGYIAGTGIVACLTNNQAIAGSDIAVADANLTTGNRYHVECFFRPKYNASSSDWHVIVQVYDENHDFIGGVRETAIISAWMNFDFVSIQATSAASTVSRFAFEPGPLGYFPSLTTSPYFIGEAVGFLENGDIDIGDANRQIGIYTPGNQTTTTPAVCMLLLHGVGSWSASGPVASDFGTNWDRANPNQYSAMTFAAMQCGIPVIAPWQYSANSTNTDSWAEPGAYTEVRDAITKVNDKLGADTRWIVYGYSMGALMACRIVQHGDVPNIIGVFLQNPVTGLFTAWSDAAFTAGINSAWNIAPVDDAAAHVELDPYDPHLVSPANAGNWANMEIQIMSTAVDGVVDPTEHIDVFSPLLTNAGIQHLHIQRPFLTHTAVMPRRDASAFISATLAAAGIGGSDGGTMNNPSAATRQLRGRSL